LRGDRLSAHARDGAQSVGRAHQGIAARFPLQSHRNADFERRTAKNRRLHLGAPGRADGGRDLPGAGVRHGAVDRARPAGRSGADQQLLEVLLHDGLAPGVGGAAGERAARLREAGAAPLHQRAFSGSACRRISLYRRIIEGIGGAQKGIRAAPRLPGPRPQERGTQDPGRAARRVLRLRRRGPRCARLRARVAGEGGGGRHPRGGLRRQRHRPLRALRLYAKHGRARRGRQTDCPFLRALNLRTSRRAFSASTLLAYCEVGSSSAPAYICSAVSMSPKRRWYSRRIWAPTRMLTSGSSSDWSPPCSNSFSWWYFGITCISPLAPITLSATGL